MHRLGREVRFSINPFCRRDEEGFNPYSSKPAGAGLALYFALWVELAGEVEPATGFVVNVADIDRCVRKYVMPIFGEQIREKYRKGRHISVADITGLLRASFKALSDKFAPANLSRLNLWLNPARKMGLCAEDTEVIYFSEKFEFAAMHRLWNEEFSEAKNFEVFGKCANPAGHGHNYVVEVTIQRPSGHEDFSISEFERIVDEEFIRLVDHKNLNVDVAKFAKVNPTVENIAAFAWERLSPHFAQMLHQVTVWETEKTSCSYSG